MDLQPYLPMGKLQQKWQKRVYQHDDFFRFRPSNVSFFASKMKKILILGGAFFALRNVNPTDGMSNTSKRPLESLQMSKKYRFHVLWVFSYVYRYIVTWT